MQVSLELAYTEDEIYELSLAREPRDSLSVSFRTLYYKQIKQIFNNNYLQPQSSPTRSLLLGEWPTTGQINQMQTSLTPSTAGNLVPVKYYTIQHFLFYKFIYIFFYAF
jgi:hypothetical protein